MFTPDGLLPPPVLFGLAATLFAKAEAFTFLWKPIIGSCMYYD